MRTLLLVGGGTSSIKSRSKQSFRFADTPVSLLFEEVSESRNFIHKELLRFQGYEELMSVANTNSELPDILVGDDNPGHDMPGAGAVTTDPSQSVERGIHDNSNRPSNHVMVESLPGDVTEPNDTPVSSDMSSAESLEADGVHSAKKPHHG
ncbi:uncharacterized protein LOC106359743 isoform X5 [Brassica napus]|uniref:uncharacterized protein LOC106359743 isoform X5 n=1 Tax=Brassica napus TaxID=3708 RepID=UPI002078C9AF|nr:uncharacterized protein LOC106359743 isoform X5 [Brassica napus]